MHHITKYDHGYGKIRLSHWKNVIMTYKNANTTLDQLCYHIERCDIASKNVITHYQCVGEADCCRTLKVSPTNVS